MTTIHAEASAIIDAAPEQVYAILTDYHHAHPAILPRPYFQGLKVEQGGRGAGTVIVVRMRVLGVERTYRETVTEPEPGRVLEEADAEAGVLTRFTVEPVGGGKQARVTIATDQRASPGLTGRLERLLNPPITRRIFQKELGNLQDYARAQKVWLAEA